MNLIIVDLLEPAQLDAVHAVLVDGAHWRDGRDTAAGAARAAKRNQQAHAGGPVRGALAVVERALMAHPLVRAAAWPRRVVRTLASRYREGMAYGTHVDAAFMDAERCDLSFTLMLSPSGDYAGGDLVIEDDSGDRIHRLERGQLLLYPADSLHRVEPVSRGERLVVVGWIQSWVADAGRRAVLFDLERTLAELADLAEAEPSRRRLLRARGRLLRMWSA